MDRLQACHRKRLEATSALNLAQQISLRRHPSQLRHVDPNQRKGRLHASQSEVVTDNAVPEGHKGLHEFLYGEGGAEAHDAVQADIRAREGEDSGEVQIPVENYLSDRFTEKRAGSYAVYGKDKSLQYIGYARSVVAAIKGHLPIVGEERCYYVRTKLVPIKKMATRNQLQADADRWLDELQERPPGNSEELQLWEGKGMMPVDKGTFQDKKLKLQKAMGEKLNETAVEDFSDAEKRDRLKKAVEGDWSEVIDEQTEEALANDRPSAAVNQIPPVSPFVRQEAPTNESASQAGQELTIENADKVLDSVRPYLIADGGNVEVVSTDNGMIQLRLQGACGTCASSSATMKMGLEKALKDAFGDAVKEVVEYDPQEKGATVAAVNAHLDMLRPAIKSYGGTVEVLSIEDQTAKVAYKGPPTIATGITAAIKGQFPDLVSVEMVAA